MNKWEFMHNFSCTFYSSVIIILQDQIKDGANWSGAPGLLPAVLTSIKF